MGYDAMSSYLPIDGLGINALPDSEKYKRGIKENRTGRARTSRNMDVMSRLWH